MSESPNYPLSTISDQLGFSNYKYFATLFKMYIHISPKTLKSLGRIVKYAILLFVENFTLI
ncbi:AraC family transcriptional regulator [Streptococcus pneumoniae]|nr:AraC family transcriptional regulator [Streptococcus pneumoniae]